MPERSPKFSYRFVLLTLLAIEFLDELIYGTREAAWPLIRDDLGLTYVQVGILLSLPDVIGNAIEPVLGILADVWKRRVLVLGGGIVFLLALLLTALSGNFALLLLAFILFSPASGAFVSLSQATLMDTDPARHGQNMARWTLAGSLGVTVGPLALGVAMMTRLGWRGIFLSFAGLALLLLVLARRFPFPTPAGEDTQGDRSGLRGGFAEALRALRRGAVIRWLVLLECSDLLLDIFLGFLALYMVDVAKMGEVQAGLALVVWNGFGLLGDFLLIPLLERVRGLTYLRISAALEGLLLIAFLLVPGFAIKLVLLGLLGLFNAGWYAILKGQLYSAMPGQSGTALAVNNVSGLVGSLLPLGLGWVAERFGLGVSMWLLLAGPIALLVGIPRSRAPHPQRS